MLRCSSGEDYGRHSYLISLFVAAIMFYMVAELEGYVPSIRPYRFRMDNGCSLSFPCVRLPMFFNVQHTTGTSINPACEYHDRLSASGLTFSS